MINLDEITESLIKKGSDPFNLSTLLNEVKKRNSFVDKDEVLEFLGSNESFAYNSTQNDIAWLMTQIGKTYNPIKVADISCGLGNILFHIDYCEAVGFEIDRNIVEIVHFISPDIKIINSSSLEYNHIESYDAIISHFPYGRAQGNGRKDELENVFIKKSIKLLNKDGVLICLVPERFLYSSKSESLRKEINDKCYLRSIISLPANYFEKTGIKMSILIIENKKSSEETQFLIFSSTIETLHNFLNPKKGFFIEKKLLSTRWDANFHDPMFLGLENALKSQETKRIEELSEIIISRQHLVSKRPIGDYAILTPRNIKDGKLSIDSKNSFVNKPEIAKYENTILQYGDIVIPTIYTEFNKLYVHTEIHQKSIIGSNLIILRSKNNEYLRTYLTTIEGRELFNQQIQKQSKGTMMPHISVSDVKKFYIPILPIEDISSLRKENLQTLNQIQLKELKSKLELSKLKNAKLREENLTLKARISLTNEMISKLDLLIHKADKIDNKIDSIIDKMNILTEDFKRIKESQGKEEDKIIRMQIQLDEKLNLLIKEKAGITNYINEVKEWFRLWDSLEPESKIFIPQAEFLLDQIYALDSPDYSPFIVQYSRALENEILMKLFNSFHEYIEQQNINRTELTGEDMENDRTKLFAKSILKDNRKYTLGTMNFIIGLLKKDSNTLSQSPLLQHFKKYTNSYFEKNILEKEYIKKLNLLVSEYRNKAAHPAVLSKDTAMTFHGLVKDCLVEFTEGYRLKPPSNY